MYIIPFEAPVINLPIKIHLYSQFLKNPVSQHCPNCSSLADGIQKEFATSSHHLVEPLVSASFTD